VRKLTPRSMQIISKLIAEKSDQLASICDGDMNERYPDKTKEIVHEFIRRCQMERQRWDRRCIRS
jgi:ssDNA-binding replication factor A large subunit